MNLHNRIKEPSVMIRIGAACLLLASLSRLFVHPSSDLARGFADGATGVLYGVFIGCFLLAARLNRRRCA